MKLHLLSGKAQNITQEGLQYQFNIGEFDVALTSKIEHFIQENDTITVVGYYFKNDRDEDILGVIAYFNHENKLRSSYKIPCYIFVTSFLLSIFFILYTAQQYLEEGVSYYILLFIAILMIPNYLGYISIRSHLMLHHYLKKEYALLYKMAFKTH